MIDSSRCIFSGMQMLIEQTWVKDHAVVIEEGSIHAIVPFDKSDHYLPAQQHIFTSDFYLIPGLIDLHIHGAGGHDVMDGDGEALASISKTLAAEGVTGFLATTMTAGNDDLEAVLKIIPEAARSKKGAAILGMHLEGPFISADKAGAQSLGKVQCPDLKLIERWQDRAEGMIKLVTLAPELPGAIPLIQALRDMNMIVSAGHTNATYAEMVAAIRAGCSQATHLFNAMRGLHQREPGAVGALLLSPDVMAELIVDGLHLHPAIVELALRLKGKEKLLLVTDAMRAKCCRDGEYDLGGQMVMVREGKAELSDGTLAGSTLRMPQALKNIVQFTSCSLADAVSMAASNPARVLGLSDRKGTIAVGKDADLVVLNASLDVVFTMREGRVVFSWRGTEQGRC